MKIDVNTISIETLQHRALKDRLEQIKTFLAEGNYLGGLEGIERMATEGKEIERKLREEYR